MSTQLPISVTLPWLKVQPQTIEEYKVAVQRKLEDYDYEVTEENRTEAEQDKASLNTAVKTISDARKRGFSEMDTIKKQMIAVEHLIEDKAKALGEQLKELDQHLLDEKWEQMETYFGSLEFDLVQLKDLVDFKWQQKNHPIEKCCKLIADKVDNIRKELDLIDSMAYTEVEKVELKATYLDVLDLTKARNLFEVTKHKKEQLRKQQEALMSRIPSEKSSMLNKSEQTSEIRTETNVSQNVAENAKKERILVEFIVEGRDFLDYMNKGIKQYHPQVRILEREEI